MSRTPPSTSAHQLVFCTMEIIPLLPSRTLRHPKEYTHNSIYKVPYLPSSFLCTTLNSQRAGYQEEFTLLDPSGPSTPVIHLASSSLAHPSALMSSAHPLLQPSSMQPNPLNDDTPTMTHDEPEANSLGRAINNLVKSNTSTSRPKLHEPNPFNGTDLHKL